MDQAAVTRLRESADFRQLERARARLSWPMAAVMLVVYFGFVVMVAFAPAVLATPVFGSITLGFPLGLGVILCAIALTGFYVFRANATLDGLTNRIAGGQK